ncbi:MAG: hypothetical protein M9928_04865 [Anaerolineae bacterium]|nr:hypothetical protein [Anaerolineae bacterium]
MIVKTNLQTGNRGLSFFSDDLNLDYTCIIDFYSLRFKSEFNFRDAKQYWGLEDFMNTQKTASTNAAALCCSWSILSYLLLRDFRQQDSTVNVLDLKAYYHCQYVGRNIKMASPKPEPISNGSHY